MIKEEIHMIKEEIEKAINPVLDEGDIPIEFIDDDNTNINTVLDKIFSEHNIKYVTSFDEMFESCGFDCWSYAIAWVEDGKAQLLVYRVVAC